jgi:hypothetical protein
LLRPLGMKINFQFILRSKASSTGNFKRVENYNLLHLKKSEEVDVTQDFFNVQTCRLSRPAVWKKQSREKITMHSLITFMTYDSSEAIKHIAIRVALSIRG